MLSCAFRFFLFFCLRAFCFYSVTACWAPSPLQPLSMGLFPCILCANGVFFFPLFLYFVVVRESELSVRRVITISMRLNTTVNHVIESMSDDTVPSNRFACTHFAVSWTFAKSDNSNATARDQIMHSRCVHAMKKKTVTSKWSRILTHTDRALSIEFGTHFCQNEEKKNYCKGRRRNGANQKAFSYAGISIVHWLMELINFIDWIGECW